VPGPLYRIGWIEVLGAEGREIPVFQSDIRSLLASSAGEDAREDVMARIEDGLTWRIRSLSHPFAKMLDRVVVREPETRTVGVRLLVDAGPVAGIGAVSFVGSRRFSQSTLASLVPFSPGDPFSPAQVASLQAALEDLGVFQRVRIELVRSANSVAQVSLRVELRDRPPAPEQLLRTGVLGIVVMTAASAALALRLLLNEGGVWARSVGFRVADLLIMLFLAGSILLAAQRIATFISPS
jgi:translocation and assembly module TamA